jgi:hypothetical protein
MMERPPQPGTSLAVGGLRRGCREESNHPLAQITGSIVSPRIPLRCIRGYDLAIPPGFEEERRPGAVFHPSSLEIEG